MEWFSPYPGETVVWTGQPRLRRILSTAATAAFWSIAALVGAFAVWRYSGTLPTGGLPRAAVWVVAAILVAFQAGKVALAYTRVQATDYVLTDENVYKKTGVLSENVTRVGVDRVQNTTLRKDFFGNMFDYGTVLLSTAGSGGAELAITDLNGPEQFRDELRPLIRAAGGPGDGRSAGQRGGLDEETATALVTEARKLRETAQRLEGRLNE